MLKRVILFGIMISILSACSFAFSGITKDVNKEHLAIINSINDCFEQDNCDSDKILTDAEKRLNNISIQDDLSNQEESDEGLAHLLTWGVYYSFSLYVLETNLSSGTKESRDIAATEYRDAYNEAYHLLSAKK